MHKMSFISEGTFYLVLNLDGKSSDVTATLTTNTDSIEFKDQGWVLNILPKPSTASKRSLLSSPFEIDEEGLSPPPSPIISPPASPTDFIIDSMGLFTKKYFAIQENLGDFQERLSPTQFKKVNFSQLVANCQENIDSGKQLIYDMHERMSPKFMKDTVQFIFPDV